MLIPPYKNNKSPASFFSRKAEMLFGTLRTKSCLSGASSFCSVEKSIGVGKKMQTANFLCFVSFVRAKEMKSLCGLSITKTPTSHYTTPPDCSAWAEHPPVSAPRNTNAPRWSGHGLRTCIHPCRWAFAVPKSDSCR